MPKLRFLPGTLVAGWHRWALPLLLCAFAAMAQAQSAPADDAGADADPPSRVARLSYLDGAVAMLPAGAQEWSDASLNRPLAGGDKLSTTPGARAELELDGGTLRIAGGTDFGLLDLDDRLAQIELTQGTLEFKVRHLDQGESYEIDTPKVALVVDRPGVFRVDVDRGSGATTIGMLAGDDATVFGENNAQRDIVAGRSYRFEDSTLANVIVQDLGGGDAFDRWNTERDRRYTVTTTTQYVDEDVVGYQDLDQYGSWQADDDYGEVWYPAAVAADWAPYRYGRWDYVGPWGWTWVDDLPWGFAPYHYGRWMHRPRGWCWIPGPRGVRPVYAPALVAFVGGGHWGGAVGIGRGPVGWFPLGPGEVYNPWYRVSHGYYARVNESNLRWRRAEERERWHARIDEGYRYYQRGAPPPNMRYVNRDAPRGFTAVDGEHFAEARHVQRHMLSVDSRQFSRAPVLARGNGLPPPAHAAAMMRGSTPAPAPAGFQREVVARHEPRPHAMDAGRVPTAGVAAPAPVPGRPSNVRMLDGRRVPGNAMHAPPAMNTQPAAGVPPSSRPSTHGFDDHRPSSTNARPAPMTPYHEARPMPGTSGRDAGALRPGELPASRFAHRPPAMEGATPAGQTPYGTRDDHRRGTPNGTLPQPPRIQSLPEQGNGSPPARVPPSHGYDASGGHGTLPTPPRFERPSSTSTPTRESTSPGLHAPQPSHEQSVPIERPAPQPHFERPASAPTPTRESTPGFRATPQPSYERPAPVERPTSQPRFERPTPESSPRPEFRSYTPAHSEPRPAPSYHPVESHPAPAAHEHGSDGGGSHPHPSSHSGDDHK